MGEAREGVMVSRDIPSLRMKLWFEKDGHNAFGMGSVLLLRGVARHGSLAGAARELGISYRTAWGSIRKIEARLGRAVLVKHGGNKSGYRLSPFGVRCLETYEAIYESALAVAQKAYAAQAALLFEEGKESL